MYRHHIKGLYFRLFIVNVGDAVGVCCSVLACERALLRVLRSARSPLLPAQQDVLHGGVADDLRGQGLADVRRRDDLRHTAVRHHDMLHQDAQASVEK